MTSAHTQGGSPSTRDVVICGGGLAGLLLARQLRQQLPALSVAVIERIERPLPDGCVKVGESSVELGSQHLESLGLTEYLLERQLVKLGLRFFPGGGALPLHERTEIGPCAEPVVRSYQLDRGRFENDLRAMAEADGVLMVEGSKVTTIEFGAGDADHAITYEGRQNGTLMARWVVDATGRQALLRKRMKLTRGAPHVASSGWFRVRGRVDINDLVPRSETEWHSRPVANERWRSTNHLMGTGYWAWVIPLSTGMTSIGLVIHEEIHDPSCIAGLDNVLAFLAEHEPHLHGLLQGYPVEDFLCLRKYSHTIARAWSEDRWAMVGEAGAFVDPLYSPGTDFITLANRFTTELIRTWHEGGEVQKKATQLNHHYRAFVTGTLDLFRRAAPVYGHPTAMATKVFWDNFSYWSFTCHFSQQHLYRLSQEEYEPFAAIGRRFLELGNLMQGFLRHWALLAPEAQRPEFIGAPHYPSILIDAHVRVGEKMTLEETLEHFRTRIVQAEEIAGEIVLRTVLHLGPDLGRQLLQESEFATWGIRIAPERIETETKTGHARRTRLST
ncbi:MAG: tryptophan 7-halogenase, partial [Planctomycetes bacterium]|nr:tryptophan 7-halogenase [Planctomycetota bacterium]